MGKIWTGEEKCKESQTNGHVETPVNSQTLLRGQTLIGQDGRLTRASAAQGECDLTGWSKYKHIANE